MKEIRQIIEAYDQALRDGKRTALATLVHVEGPSYRRPGARMLVTEEGELTGAISGGCLEGDALRKAVLAITQQQSRLVTYDTRDEEDAFIGRQLGCSGVIQVLFEPIVPENPVNPIELLRLAMGYISDQVILTIFDLSDKQAAHPGTSVLFQQDQSVGLTLLTSMLQEDLEEVWQEKTSRFVAYPDGKTVFFEFVRQPVQLHIIGAGNDVQPMVSMAQILGWQVQILDGRATHARADRFPSCQVIVGKPDQIIQQIGIHDRTAVVLMTHNFQYDLAVLRLLIDKPLPYIGILGPAKKTERLLEEIKKEKSLEADDMQRIYGPTGLDIGAESPEEIALSIIAEIQAVMHQASGGFLREKNEVIHERSKTTIQIRS